MATVLVPIAGGFEDLEAVALIDVMRRAEIEVIVAGVSELNVTGANGITIQTERLVEGITADDIDMIVLPGGWDGTYALADDDNVQNLLKAMDAKGKRIGAICAAPFALNKAGVLKQHYTCYPSVEEQIGRTDGYTTEQKVVEDGNVLTSRGPGTAICFGLEIVKRLVNEATYLGLKEGLLATYCD
jgi:4-methyl-5(b-hydroxyethyl)-thiazole monophosphate biosynthesis